MVYFLCSLYKEAEGIISYFHLKKISSISSFQEFEGDGIKLIISGTGKINAACAVGCILSQNNHEKSDIFINVGICGSDERSEGEAFFINKIKDVDSGEEYYPDIIIKHPFKEAYLETHSKVVKHGDIRDLCDMEGSAFFKSALKFMYHHQIAIIKIVSDTADNKLISGDYIKNIISKNLGNIKLFIDCYLASMTKNQFFSEKDKAVMSCIDENLKLTESQNIEFRKAYIALKLRGAFDKFDFQKFLNVRVTVKSESRKYFNELISAMWES
ncbi:MULTISPECIES: 5'-methylthioadenosine/S-adenosylhomocysteine nucleosidase family protein [Clostridium]|uniref:5'-methylthioadenosine/S-adenosylhomocysteine nucleosidase family protein n=1 Tax=Clostridium TaxID=1485 RepID=UPI00069D1AE9|nr:MULTISPECIES: hypothetical protein [Clostridium]KOF56669.1 membrane protein [Clostridium sp. DMHC 10]MCD2346707.1 hypothetical protein [Clostridium guangxiense]